MVPIGGGVAGVIATLVMSAFMVLAGRLGLVGEQPPRTVTRRIFDRKPFIDSEKETDVLASAAHLAFGSGAGAAFGLVSRPAPTPALPFLGMAYGLALWAGSYAGWIPALHIMQPPDRDRRERQASMLAAHLIFGAALGLVIVAWRNWTGDGHEDAVETRSRDAQPAVSNASGTAGG